MSHSDQRSLRSVETTNINLSPAKPIPIQLSDDERRRLWYTLDDPASSAIQTTRATILLGSEAGKSHAEIIHQTGVSANTISRVRRQFVDQGVDAVLRPATGGNLVSGSVCKSSTLAKALAESLLQERKSWETLVNPQGSSETSFERTIAARNTRSKDDAALAR